MVAKPKLRRRRGRGDYEDAMTKTLSSALYSCNALWFVSCKQQPDDFTSDKCASPGLLLALWAPDTSLGRKQRDWGQHQELLDSNSPTFELIRLAIMV